MGLCQSRRIVEEPAAELVIQHYSSLTHPLLGGLTPSIVTSLLLQVLLPSAATTAIPAALNTAAIEAEHVQAYWASMNKRDLNKDSLLKHMKGSSLK